MTTARRIVLIGLSGTGKSTVGRAAAQRLGWDWLDTDEAISQSFGRTIAEIFAVHGEAAFRDAERRILTAALERSSIVIACGGGAVLAPEIWSTAFLRHPETLVITLDASPESSLARLRDQQAAEGEAAARPLLAATDPLPKIRQMKAERQAIYDQGDVTLITDGATVAELAAEVAWLVQPRLVPGTPTLTLRASSGASDIHLALGAGDDLADLVRLAYPKARRTWVITDSDVGHLHGDRAVAALGAGGITAALLTVPAGEASKSLAVVSEVYDWLLGQRIERRDVVIALGGGVIGDLAGFVAATVLRGVGLVQVPTSLLAMVDSSVGGKTGVDHAQGKNLIGAFYQPRVVVIDPDYLDTLPARQLANGRAEMIKHAIIQRATPNGDRGDLLRFGERNAEAFTAGSRLALTYLIRRNIALKAAVVEADEREAGVRAYLNFGHTLGHAIEAADYAHLHGEAIAIGMRAEAILGGMVGTCDQTTVDRISDQVAGAGLPLTTAAAPDDVMARLGSDKKRDGGAIRWVLPITGGGVTVRDDVPDALVRAALAAVTAQGI